MIEISCHQCGTRATKYLAAIRLRGGQRKHSFCGNDCYDLWRRDERLRFEKEQLAFRREVWGTAAFERRAPQGKYARQVGRQAEIVARDRILPAIGFSEIEDLSGMSNQFFIDFVATYGGLRVLVDATIKLKAYVPEKSRLALALRMPLYILHVSPKSEDLYYLNSLAPGRVVCRVPATFINAKRCLH